jgi:Raf kinase inhibitor-like YbhB/YbcL family protein
MRNLVWVCIASIDKRRQSKYNIEILKNEGVGMRFIIIFLFILNFSYAGTFTLTSVLGGQLTKKEEFQGFGCTGKNMSPALHWVNAPKGTKSFAVTMYDPDAPTGSGWWHWIVYNIPENVSKLKSDASALKILPQGALEGMTSYGFKGFGGACPPRGDKAHGYVITVYALNVAKLHFPKNATSELIGYEINAHTIQRSSIVAYYGRK